jgi:integrase
VYVYDEYQKGVDPEVCVARIIRPHQAAVGARSAVEARGFPTSESDGSKSGISAKPLSVEEWSDLIEAFREHKLLSGEIKASTWQRVYRHHMKHVLGAMAMPSPPQNAKQLLEGLARIWADKPGGRTRQIQMQCTTALLRWAIGDQRLGEEWEPPQNLATYVGRSRTPQIITTPLDVEHILALVDALPDPRWRLGFQLMAAYGLRPEELQHLQLRDGRLWCAYEKVASRGKTKPRALRLLPCDDWAAEWKLAERFCPEELPPMRAGFAGNDFGQYLRRRSLWEKLRQTYEAKGEKLVPYSCRHGYAHRAHVICDLPPKVVAAAMGHSVQTHLAAYSRWCGDDVVDDAYEKASMRLSQK